MIKGNLFDPIKPTSEEFVEIIASGESKSYRLERIVSHGQISHSGFWYDQDEWEWVTVLQGSAELESESERFTMTAGDWLMIPAHERHRVTYTSSNPPCVWLAVFGR